MPRATMSTRSRRCTGARRSRAKGCSKALETRQSPFDQGLTRLDRRAGAARAAPARRGRMEWEDPEANRACVPPATVLASIAGLWLCYFVLTTLRSEVLGFGFPLEMMWRRALACLAGIGITAMLWLILRLFDARPLWMKIIAALLVSVPAAVLIVQSNGLVFADIEQKAAQNMAAGQGRLSGDPLASDPMPDDDDDPAAAPSVVVRQVPLSPLQSLME